MLSAHLQVYLHVFMEPERVLRLSGALDMVSERTLAEVLVSSTCQSGSVIMYVRVVSIQRFDFRGDMACVVQTVKHR